MKTKNEVKDYMQPEAVKAQIISGGVIAILRGDFRSHLIPIAEVLADAGIPAIEITMNSPDALVSIEELTQAVGHRMLIGAGTVIDPAQVGEVADAGGLFIVAPNVDPYVIETSKKADLLVIPGAYTATEIVKAWQLGANLVKLFPATAGGPGYLRAMRGPLGHIPMVPTGGVSGENAASFIAAGAAALGAGGSLVNPDILTLGGLELLRERADRLMAAVAVGRKKEGGYA
jgi:2-dehydro-3-deoxyphosphogluconate aldolase/(4S)-4-hydroxy-2-oxoglutarate aldolase